MTAQDKTQIRALIEAVEAGTWEFDINQDPSGDMSFAILGKYSAFVLAWDAFRGSLDAAKALHEALLPGWKFKLEAHAAISFAWIGHPNEMLFRQHQSSFDTLARAWLLAILKAYEKQK